MKKLIYASMIIIYCNMNATKHEISISVNPSFVQSYISSDGQNTETSVSSSISTQHMHLPQSKKNAHAMPETYPMNEKKSHISEAVNINLDQSPTFVQTSLQQNAQSEKTQKKQQFDKQIPEETFEGFPEEGASSSQSSALSSWSLSSLGLLVPKLAIGGIGLCYTAVLTKMLYTSYVTLAKNDTWSSWKQHIPLNILNNAESQLTKELFADIQAKYSGSHNESSFLNPLVHFYNDVDTEIAELQKFITLHDWINYLKVAPLFPRQTESLHLAVKKIKRLDHLKKLVVKSIAEYKVNA